MDIKTLDHQALNHRARDYQCPSQAFRDRIILVTGAGAGIGRAVALALADRGATVILLGRTQSKLEAVYDEIRAAGGAEPALAPVDLEAAGAGDYQELAGLFAQEFGRLDGVLHNASILGTMTPVENYPAETWEAVMRINASSAFLLTQAMLPLLRNSSDGRILFTTSSVGRRGRAYWGAYAASKAAVENLSQTLADELENLSPIRVNTINPGATRTAMRAHAYPGEEPARLNTPADIVAPYLFLLGPDSTDLTGHSLDAQP